MQRSSLIVLFGILVFLTVANWIDKFTNRDLPPIIEEPENL